MRATNRCFILICETLLTLSLAACSHKSAAEHEEPQGGGSDAATAEVTLTRVARADVSQSLLITGNIAALPNQDVRISSQVPGRIAQLLVAEGDSVTAGQLVAQIDDRPFRDQLQQAEAATAQARASRDNARLARARNESLLARGIVARRELEDARTQESVSEAALRQAEAALALARLQVSRTEVRSPLAGKVVKRFVSVGEQVDGTAGQPILEVANQNPVELFGNVPAVYLTKIRLGQVLPVRSDAFPGKEFTGRVVAISPAVDSATNAGLIRIRIANPEGWLRLGMFLGAQVPIETHRNVLTVPPQAIYRDPQGQAQVYRVEGNNATAVPVQVGLEMPERVELFSGVQAGDKVILTGGYGLGQTAKVTVKGAANP